MTVIEDRSAKIVAMMTYLEDRSAQVLVNRSWCVNNKEV